VPLSRINDRFRPLYDVIYGLVFFATSYREGNNTSIGDRIAKITKTILRNSVNNLLKALKSSSYFVEIMRNDFMKR
jgi:hypothetical protein